MPPQPQSPFHRDDLDTLRTRAGELEQEVARRRREAAVMAAAAHLAGESLDVEDLAEGVARSILQLFGASSARVRRLEPAGSLAALARAGRSSVCRPRPCGGFSSPSSPQEAPKPRPAPPRPSRPARVRLIADEAGVRAVLRELLSGEGYTVVDVPDGPSGLALCETEAIDVVLSDASMRGMSGWEVAQACHARFPDVLGRADHRLGRSPRSGELARRGVRFVVAKPFEAEVLHRVGDALGG